MAIKLAAVPAIKPFQKEKPPNSLLKHTFVYSQIFFRNIAFRDINKYIPIYDKCLK